MSEPGQTLTQERDGPGVPVYTIEVTDIPEDLLQRLDERARTTGRDRSQVIRELIARELGAEEPPLASHSFDAVLAPIREGFTESGLSEEEATDLLEAGLRAVRAEKRQANASTPPSPTTKQP